MKSVIWMNNGHLELGEIVVIALLLIGVVAGLFFFMNPFNQTVWVQPPVGNVSVANNSSAVTVPPVNISLNTSVSPGKVPSSVQVQTNETLAQLMDDGMSRADSRFHNSTAVVSGNYTISTFHFALGDENNSPDSTPLVKNDLRVSQVLFNGHYVDSLRAFIFRAYIPNVLSGPQIIYGTAVFFSNETPLDSSTSFTMYYGTDPQGPQELDGCSVLSKNVSLTASGNAISVYDVSCKFMSAAYP